jgi:hypothetical protein
MNSEIIPINLSNIKQILNIQNKYIELTWRYIIYKYDYIRAVQCFSHFIRCIFAVHDIAIQTYDVQWLTDTFNNLIQKIEQND